MPKVAVYNIEGTVVGEVELSDAIFASDVNTHVIHQVVHAQLANKRQGTKSTLTRTEVAGGGKKPWRQKGTGRARQGSTRAPQWIKGGVVFAPKPRDFSITVPKKIRRLALKGVLTCKFLEEGFIVVENLALEIPKTKEMIKVLANLKIEGKTLIVTSEPDSIVDRSASNIPGVNITLVNTLNVLDIIRHDKMLVTKDALAKIEEVYA